jgi:hypothetical protein
MDKRKPQLSMLVPNVPWVLDTTGKTLAQAQQSMLRGAEGGIECECCHGYVKVYKRRIHREMALFLMRLVEAWEKEPRWYHTRDFNPTPPKSSTDASYLVHWGLVECREGEAGWYRPTEAGIEYAHGRLKVPSWIRMLNNVLLEKSAEMTGISVPLSA